MKFRNVESLRTKAPLSFVSARAVRGAVVVDMATMNEDEVGEVRLFLESELLIDDGNEICDTSALRCDVLTANCCCAVQIIREKS